jgi:hypothetical protein
MTMKRYAYLIALMFVFPSFVFGQNEYTEESVFSDYLNPQRETSFLYIPGLNFHSSVGFSYFSSQQFGSAGYGFYMGHFDLRLSSTLRLRWDIGLRSMMTGPSADETPEFFIPNVDLTYRPSDKFMLRFQFHQYRHPTTLLRMR